MKLVSFSPWQHTATSIPSSQNEHDIIQNFIISPSTTNSSMSIPPSSKRIRSSKSHSTRSMSLEMNPVVSITSNHHISIIGHPQSNKILRNATGNSEGKASDEDNTILKEVPQWMYTSRPGPTTAFFPSRKNGNKKSSSSSSQSLPHIRKLGAVIDPTSRTIFALQNDNKVMKVWGLADDVNGPDDEQVGSNSNGNTPIHKVQFESPVLCMNSIPIRRQVRVKIKGGEKNQHNNVHGGVAGLLMNGQMFVVLVCMTDKNLRRIKVGMFGKNLREKIINEYLYSVVGFTAGGRSDKGSTTYIGVGMKRKLESVDDGDDELGEITLTAISRNVKQSDCITFTKHTVLIPSLKESELQDGVTDGKYSKEAGDVKLPHSIIQHQPNGNGSSASHNDILVTQLDISHVSLVYQDNTQMWYTTILDTRYGECVIKPFPLGNVRVVDIGGLSSSILAVLTSDSLLTIYDARRAVKLHDIDVRKALKKDENGSKCTFGIAAHWFTGTIGIMCNTKGESGSTVSLSCARVGVYDTEERIEVMEAGRKPFAKGTYNLARIISSSSVTTKNENQKLQMIELDLENWYPSSKRKSYTPQASHEATLSDITMDLIKYRQTCLHQNGSKPKPFIEKFEEIVNKVNIGTTEKRGKDDSSNSVETCTSLPQPLIEMIFSIAVQIILTREKDSKEKINAAKVLFRCIETKKVSARNQFNKRKGVTLRNLLLTLQKTSLPNEQNCLSLRLISSLLLHCKKGITEEMLVSMMHFVICYTNNEQLEALWQNSHGNGWYNDQDIKLLEKRLKTALKKIEESKNGKNERLNDMIALAQTLTNRLALARQLYLIGKIVTYCQCNPALLRSSLQNGLTQANSGEVQVLVLALGKLIRKLGNNRKMRSADCPNRLSCISQWLSAVVDTQLENLLSGNNGKTINRVKKEVSTSILQTKTILSLKELFNQVDKMIVSEKDNEGAKMDIASVPLYGIEPLIF